MSSRKVNYSVVILLIFALFAVTLAQNHRCILQDNCEKCLLVDSSCGWCTDRGYNLNKPRCMTVEKLSAAGCNSVYQNSFVALEIVENRELNDYSYGENAEGSSVTVEKTKLSQSSSKWSKESSSSSSSASKSSGSQSSTRGEGSEFSSSASSGKSSLGGVSQSSYAEDVIQIQPQRLKLSIAKGQTQNFKFRYRPAKNYPLDLYYLMDLTYTMRDDKDTLERMAKKMANKIHSLSENYRIGFGSFSDKTIMPFAFMHEESQKNPCAYEHQQCARNYGFRHSLNFTTDMDDFVTKVRASEISGNADNPEGGLDALVQVLVCGEQVGWDEVTRKIIVFATDSEMHLAGEGKLGGIVERNDGKCHLDSKGEYSKSLSLDYPSLEQIFRLLTKNKMSVIFAVTSDQVRHYDRVHQLMKEMSSVGILEKDSSNIIQLIEKGYQEFLKRVQFTDNAPDNVRVEYWTDCGGLYTNLQPLDRCDNIEEGKIYDFYVNVTLLEKEATQEGSFARVRRSSGADGYGNYHFRIEESSLSEGVDVDLEVRELCGCLQEEAKEKSSPLCSSFGEYACGMCFCDSGRSGRTCECGDEFTSDKEQEKKCRPPLNGQGNVTEFGSVCSEAGTCICGQCHCYKGKTGQYCQCEDCPRYNDLECGGFDRAFCDCGQCMCQNGWTGERCDCNPSKDKCYPPNNPKSLCSGNGDCKCGNCKCDFGFMGDFCESMTGEDSALCLFYEPCVRCLINRNGNGTACQDLTDFCTDPESGREFDYIFNHNLDSDRVRCVVRTKKVDKAGNELENGEVCEHYFTYRVDEEGQSLLAIDESSCVPVNFALMSGLIILGTLLLGLAIFLIIKTYFYFTDKRIMAEFHKQEKMTVYREVNPLFKSAWTEYRVPDEYRFSQEGSNRESFVVKPAAFKE